MIRAKRADAEKLRIKKESKFNGIVIVLMTQSLVISKTISYDHEMSFLVHLSCLRNLENV